jgi:hypothetical protein
VGAPYDNALKGDALFTFSNMYGLLIGGNEVVKRGISMGLISCPDCEKEVSDRALTCIGCGAPLGQANSKGAVQPELPTAVTFERKNGHFHGTVPLIAKLAVQAIQELKWKVDAVNDGIGLVSFQTGVSWGSWSGVSGSLSINLMSDNLYEVVGTGKQNLRGGQFVALNIGGDAQKKVNAVCDKMQSMCGSYIDPNAEPTLTLQELEAKLKR